jgi:hypothetical protein
MFSWRRIRRAMMADSWTVGIREGCGSELDNTC